MTNSFLPANLRSMFLGFDDLFNRIDTLPRIPQVHFPHYNVVKGDDNYSIEVALAGFKKEDVHVEHDKKRGVLRISGKAATKSEAKRFLTQGISSREFMREFAVADGVEVEEAKMEDGILSVKLIEPLKKAAEKPLMITVK